MKSFKVRKVLEKEFTFKVEIEFLDDGEREKHNFSKGNGFEDLDADGVPFYVKEIARRIKKREQVKEKKVGLQGLNVDLKERVFGDEDFVDLDTDRSVRNVTISDIINTKEYKDKRKNVLKNRREEEIRK